MPELPRKTSATREPPPATLPPRPSRFKSWGDWLVAARNWFLDTFSRDRMVGFLKTLVWVAPLTLLIWVYAEREQVSTSENEPIPFELASSDMSRIVSLRGGDRNLLVDLQGPRARVEDVLEKLRGGTFPQGIRIEPDPALSVNEEHDIPTKPLLERNAIFRDNGITALRAQPSRLKVVIDELDEREARVLAPTTVTNLLPATTFSPATVKVRGPKSLLDEAERQARQAGGQLSVFADIEGLAAVKTPGVKTVPAVSIQLPRALSDERVAVVPKEVDATLHVRENNAELAFDSLPVWPVKPQGLDDKYKVVLYNASLPNVTLVGPKDQIHAIRQSVP